MVGDDLSLMVALGSGPAQEPVDFSVLLGIEDVKLHRQINHAADDIRVFESGPALKSSRALVMLGKSSCSGRSGGVSPTTHAALAPVTVL